MGNTERLSKIAELAKNIAVVLGLPALGIYMVKYHNDQMSIKDSLIELREAQVAQAEQFSVERMNNRFIALKSLYEAQMESSDDSLRQTRHILDSLTSVLAPSDTLVRSSWRQYGDLAIVPIDQLRQAAAYRMVQNERLRDCIRENARLKGSQPN